ncbi:MAG: hypothetical protein IT371_07910 [Deltaproteobacteria bacterium]|nr:hypothetical protein [Deltaproteobacteria bacterium]
MTPPLPGSGRPAGLLLVGVALLMMGSVLLLIYSARPGLPAVLWFGPEIYFLAVGASVLARTGFGRRHGGRALTFLLVVSGSGLVAAPLLAFMRRLPVSVAVLAALTCLGVVLAAAAVRRPFERLAAGYFHEGSSWPTLLPALLISLGYTALVALALGGGNR